MKPLALFDFCETLVSFQTAGAYVDFVRNKSAAAKMQRLNRIRVQLKKWKIITLLNKIFPYANIEKKIELYQLKGFSKEMLEQYAAEYYQHKIAPCLIPELVAEMARRQNEGYELAIVSGGYSIYLHHFARACNIPHVIATEIAFDSNNISTGKIKGQDCMYQYKINRVEAYFSQAGFNKKTAVVYSDSITDMPLLKWAGSAVVVSKNETQPWAMQQHFPEIIWKTKQQPTAIKG